MLFTAAMPHMAEWKKTTLRRAAGPTRDTIAAARVVFDGVSATVTRRLNPVPSARTIRPTAQRALRGSKAPRGVACAGRAGAPR
ncbi:hypothetical protein GCM10012280_35710 [Wenjunlia tyrosinilytica]|uniref:Uncharacterized protein n=1 Tax=Wenjunlia tyrosinilytica TaxID=1544741 RepID=A0A918DZK1_9ACTN|nr:hypothetical protein GCM10012280_35710 [Wenjunlia tyrosinilytica]